MRTIEVPVLIVEFESNIVTFSKPYARYMYRRAELNIKHCEDMSMI